MKELALAKVQTIWIVWVGLGSKNVASFASPAAPIVRLKLDPKKNEFLFG